MDVPEQGNLLDGTQQPANSLDPGNMPSPPRRETREREMLHAFGELGAAKEVRGARCLVVLVARLSGTCEWLLRWKAACPIPAHKCCALYRLLRALHKRLLHQGTSANTDD